jgi:hypothetical protein
MFWVWLVVAAIIIICGFIFMCFLLSDGEIDEPETFVEGLRLVSMFTAGSWALGLLWPLVVVSIVPVLIVYGLWRLSVEGLKLKAERKKEASV